MIRPLTSLKLELGEEQRAGKDYSVQIADIANGDDTLALLEQRLQDEMEHARWLKAQIRSLETRAWAAPQHIGGVECG